MYITKPGELSPIKKPDGSRDPFGFDVVSVQPGLPSNSYTQPEDKKDTDSVTEGLMS